MRGGKVSGGGGMGGPLVTFVPPSDSLDPPLGFPSVQEGRWGAALPLWLSKDTTGL